MNMRLSFAALALSAAMVSIAPAAFAQEDHDQPVPQDTQPAPMEPREDHGQMPPGNRMDAPDVHRDGNYAPAGRPFHRHTARFRRNHVCTMHRDRHCVRWVRRQRH